MLKKNIFEPFLKNVILTESKKTVYHKNNVLVGIPLTNTHGEER